MALWAVLILTLFCWDESRVDTVFTHYSILRRVHDGIGLAGYHANSTYLQYSTINLKSYVISLYSYSFDN